MHPWFEIKRNHLKMVVSAFIIRKAISLIFRLSLSFYPRSWLLENSVISM